MIEFEDSPGLNRAFSEFNLSPITARKGFYYRSFITGRRLYFSENEIVSILPQFDRFTIITKTGGKYDVRSSVPEESCYEAPARESVKGDHYFHRS